MMYNYNSWWTEQSHKAIKMVMAGFLLMNSSRYELGRNELCSVFPFILTFVRGSFAFRCFVFSLYVDLILRRSWK